MSVRQTRRQLRHPIRASVAVPGALPWIGGDVSGPAFIDLSAAGVFTRSGEGSYLTSAPTDGSVAFLAWAATDARRFEDRGDGAGALLLLERASTNKILNSRDITAAAQWTLASSGATITANAGNGPDATAVADRVNAAGTPQFSRGQNVSSMANPHVCSSWGRATSGTSRWQPGPNALWNVAAQTTVYARQSGVRAATSTGFYAIDTTANSPQDVLIDLHQAEDGNYPTSAIRTTTAAVTRGADSLTFATGTYSPLLLTARFRVRQVSPIFAHTSLSSGDVRWLLTVGSASDGIRIRHTGSDVRVEAVAGGSVKASSAAQTFAAHGLLGAIDWDPVGAVVRVGGVAGSTGTAWTWPTGQTLRVGGIAGSSGSDLDGRIYPLIEVV